LECTSRGKIAEQTLKILVAFPRTLKREREKKKRRNGKKTEKEEKEVRDPTNLSFPG